MSAIYADAVPESRRAGFVHQLFGLDFPLRLEPAVYAIASHLCRAYGGGVWDFYALCNGGFYMAPRGYDELQVRCENGFEGALTADAFGVTVCLYAFSQLSFSKDERFAQVCAEHFHRLRAFAGDHQLAQGIFAAID